MKTKKHICPICMKYPAETIRIARCNTAQKELPCLFICTKCANSSKNYMKGIDHNRGNLYGQLIYFLFNEDGRCGSDGWKQIIRCMELIENRIDILLFVL